MFEVSTRRGLTDDALDSCDLRPAQVLTRCDGALQRAEGVGHLVIRGSQRGNQIVDLLQQSPIRILLPKVAAGAIEEAVFANTGGGIAGGDRLESSVTALAGAS